MFKLTDTFQNIFSPAGPNWNFTHAWFESELSPAPSRYSHSPARHNSALSPTLYHKLFRPSIPASRPIFIPELKSFLLEGPFHPLGGWVLALTHLTLPPLTLQMPSVMSLLQSACEELWLLKDPLPRPAETGQVWKKVWKLGFSLKYLDDSDIQ